MEERFKEQHEQIEKLWDAIESIRKEIARIWSAVTELKTSLVGMDGTNGMNSKIKNIEKIVGDISAKLDAHPVTCPIGKSLVDHIQNEEKIVTNKRLDWGKLMQTLSTFTALAMMFYVIVTGKR